MGTENLGDEIVFFKDRVFSDENGLTETGDWITPVQCPPLRDAKEIIFVLDVTAAATEAGDILAVKVQEGLPISGGYTPNDRVRFTNILGNGGAKQFVAKIVSEVAVSGSNAPVTSLAAATVVDGPITDHLRWTIAITQAATNNNESFTASLKAYVKC